MAKESVTKFERHVEKGVLGLTAIVLLGAVAWFGVMQPNSLTFDGQDVVTPATVGDKVREKADFLQRKLVSANPEAVVVESALPRFEEALDSLAYAGVDTHLEAVVKWQPPVPQAGRLAPQEGELLLTSVPKTTRPIVTAGRTTLLQLPPGNIGEGTVPGAGLGTNRNDTVVYEVAANWVTVAAVFDIDEQQKRNRLANYNPSMQSVDMLGLELQRRAQRADGTWSDSDWESIQSYRTYELPQTPQVQLTPSANGMRADQASRYQAQDYWDSISPPDKQLELMRPNFPLPLNGSPWKPPVIEGVDLVKIDNELRWPDDASHRYDPFDISPTGKEPPDMGEIVKKLLEDAEAAIAQKQWKKAEAHLENFRMIPTSTSDQQEKEEELRDEIALGRAIAAAGVNPNAPRPQLGPPPRTPNQMLWAHDARRDSVKGGTTYQYRVRARVYNRYFAQPTQLKTDEDATKIAITGEWSEPSDPIYIPPESQFFVKTAVASKGLVKIHAFQWESGVVVTETLEVRPGELIADASREIVPDGPPRLVTFETGATVVDLDFDRLIYERKRARKVDFESRPTPTLAMVYLDADGILREKLLSMDKEAPEYKQSKGEVYKAALGPKEEDKVTGNRTTPPPGAGGRRGTPPGAGKGKPKGKGGRGPK